jgi:hypothetical protein
LVVTTWGTTQAANSIQWGNSIPNNEQGRLLYQSIIEPRNVPRLRIPDVDAPYFKQSIISLTLMLQMDKSLNIFIFYLFFIFFLSDTGVRTQGFVLAGWAPASPFFCNYF